MTSKIVNLHWERGCDTCGNIMRAGTDVVCWDRWGTGYSYHHQNCAARELSAIVRDIEAGVKQSLGLTAEEAMRIARVLNQAG